MDGVSDNSEFWGRVRGGDLAAREQVIAENVPFVRILAAKLYANRMDAGFEFDDFFQFGLLGLIEAVDRYRPDLGAAFKTFASYRIKGAILDGVSGMSEAQRQIEYYSRLKRERVSSIAQGSQEGGEDTEAMIARLGGIVAELTIGIMLEGSGSGILSLEMHPDVAYGGVEIRNLHAKVISLLDQLSPQEARVIRSHYLQQMAFDELSHLLGVSKGRVSQIHKQALTKLRQALQGSSS